MKISKKALLFEIFLATIIVVMGAIHNLGLDKELLNLEENTEPLMAYNTFYDLFLQLLTWILVAAILTMIWGIILEAISPKMTKTVLNTLRVLGRMIIIPFCIIAFLNNFPAFQGTLLGVSAILGTAIGFASTNTIGNFLSGLYIMAARPFLIGDYIVLPDSKQEGRVKEITINYTKITLPTGNTILIPNNKFLGQSIINTRTSEDQLILSKNAKRRFSYPLFWATNADEKHQWSVEAIEKTGEEYSNKLMEPISWYVYSRNRLDKTYQISVISDSATKLLNITSDFMTSLTANYDFIKEKYTK